MEKPNEILVLGATGRTGKHILKFALERGYSVSCLVRDPNGIKQHPKLSITTGNPANKEDLKAALKGCDAVISALNISRTSDFPWAPIRTPKTFLSDTMQQIVSLSKKQNIKRIILCSAWGVGNSRKDIPLWFRWTIDFSNIKFAYKDHQRQEEILKNSGINFTIVRPVGLINSKLINSIKESTDNSPKPSLLISRKSVANYMVNCLTETTNTIVVISNP